MTGTVTPPTQPATRQFGRYAILQMLGRSQASGCWLAHDPRLQQDVTMVVPRTAPPQAADRERWVQEVQLGARLKHPRLAEVLEVGVLDAWPFATTARNGLTTLLERVQAGPALTPVEVATLTIDVLDGLAYAHEAGRAHQDIALHHILLDKNGRAMLAGLGCGVLRPQGKPGAASLNMQQTHREATERDMLMVGLLMYRLLANGWPLDDNDLGHASERVGPEIVRLPFATPHPIPETLRAIVNRATDRQQRQRYLNARTLLSALQGWVKTNSQDDGGPLVLLLDRLNTVGSLPGRPNTERALIGALSQETMRVDDFVDVVLKNPAMSWEMMRMVNTASFRSRSSEEGVTTLSRAVLFLGQEGVRKLVQSVRGWPGALAGKVANDKEAGGQSASTLEEELRMCCLAAHVARWMAPFELSDEECALTAMSQRLGWLLVLYHFPEEAAQMKRLTLPGPPTEPGAAPTPGMTLDGAAAAVMGINLDELTQSVLKHWGWEERLMQASRPLPRNAPVHTPHTDEETLRAVASLANEIVNTQAMPLDKAVSAMHQIQLRYARPLHLEARECQATLDHAMKLIDRPVNVGGEPELGSAPRGTSPKGGKPLSSAPSDAPMAPVTRPAPLAPQATPGPQPGGLRARLQGRTGQG